MFLYRPLNFYIVAIVPILGLLMCNSCSHGKKSVQTVYIFSHGIADTHKQAFQFAKTYHDKGKLHHNERYIIHDPYYSFDYPDATERFWKINFWKTSLGQKSDIETLAHEYNKVIQAHPHAEIVLLGLSRGAAAALNFYAQYQPTQVKALVLESPFDSINNVMTDQFKRLKLEKLPLSHSLSKKLPEMFFGDYKSSGVQPIDIIEKIPQDLPILVICSLEDKIVPCASTKNLYENLRRTGHKNTHMLVLNKGKHGYLFTGPEAEKYHGTVHAFYKQYHLPYDKNDENRYADFFAKIK